MTDTPTVSVVIPSARGGDYLRQAIASVRNQSMDDWELIVVLDGSQQRLIELGAHPYDPRIRLWRQERSGASVARNVGVAHARGRYVAFLDDDDRMAPHRLSYQLGCFSKHPEAVLCHTQFRFIDGDGTHIKDGGAKDAGYLDLLRLDGGALLSSVMVKRETFNAVGGFNPLLPIGEDLDFILRVAHHGPMAFIPTTLTDYRLHQNNTWAKNSTSSNNELRAVLAQHRITANAAGDQSALKAIRSGLRHLVPAKTQWAIERAEESFAAGHYVKAIISIGNALLRSPLVTTRVAYRRAGRAS